MMPMIKNLERRDTWPLPSLKQPVWPRPLNINRSLVTSNDDGYDWKVATLSVWQCTDQAFLQPQLQALFPGAPVHKNVENQDRDDYNDLPDTANSVNLPFCDIVHTYPLKIIK